MCQRDNDGLISISIKSSRQTINSSSTFTIPQRAGRVRLTVSLQDGGTVELISGPATGGNTLAFVSNPASPVVIDINHWGRILEGQFTISNQDSIAHTVAIVEHVEAL